MRKGRGWQRDSAPGAGYAIILAAAGGPAFGYRQKPHELHLTVGRDGGNKYACPVCGARCSVHDFQEKTWRHLNLFQHHCHVHASVPRVNCPEHGVKLIEVP